MVIVSIIMNSIMPRKTTKTSSIYLSEMSIAELCDQYWFHHFGTPTQTAAQREFSQRLKREAHEELTARLGPREVECALDGYLVGAPKEEPPPVASPTSPKPQRLRAPRIMYIEQKTDGNRILDDRGPAVIGEVTFSKTGRTIYYKGKTYHREKSACGNYRCVEDGNAYWISGVKKRYTNRHWAGSGPIVDDTK